MIDVKSLIPMPICYLCQKEVDKMEWHDDFASCKLVVIVYCHGDREYCKFSRHFDKFYKLEQGYAFNKKLIEEGNAPLLT